MVRQETSTKRKRSDEEDLWNIAVSDRDTDVPDECWDLTPEGFNILARGRFVFDEIEHTKRPRARILKPLRGRMKAIP